MIFCKNCKYWDFNTEWNESGLFDLNKTSNTCNFLNRISDHVEIIVYVHGNATAEFEVSTRGDFGCNQGKLK